MKMRVTYYLMILMFSSCSFFRSEPTENLEESENEVVDSSVVELKNDLKTEKKKVVKTKTAIDTLELKHAQLWARVDELESLIQLQKQKIKLLEQGLMLGIAPEEMKNSLAKIDKEMVPKDVKIEDKNPKDVNVATANEKSDPKYRQEIDEAKLMFQSGRYGKAYLAFAKIEKDYENKATDGEEKFWLGRCWEKLKEYQTSKKHFEEFIQKYPNSPFNVSAKFYLGKVELEMGLKELAIKRFQEIIQEHPYDGTSEAAKQLLANLKNSL